MGEREGKEGKYMKNGGVGLGTETQDGGRGERNKKKRSNFLRKDHQ